MVELQIMPNEFRTFWMVVPSARRKRAVACEQLAGEPGGVEEAWEAECHGGHCLWHQVPGCTHAHKRHSMLTHMAFVIASHHEINMLPTYARMTASTFGEQATARPGPGG